MLALSCFTNVGIAPRALSPNLFSPAHSSTLCLVEVIGTIALIHLNERLPIKRREQYIVNMAREHLSVVRPSCHEWVC